MRKTVIQAIAISLMLVVLSVGASFAAQEEGVRVGFIKGDISLGNDGQWQAAKAVKVPLLALETTNALKNGTVPTADAKALNSNARYVFNLSKQAPTVTVKAVHNGKKVAFQLTWDDATSDTENAIDTFRDSVALMFPVNQAATFYPSPLMGAKGEPVNVWQWRADWQAEKDGKRNLDARQPLTGGVHVSYSDAILKTQYPEKPSPDATMIQYISEGYGTLTKLKHQSPSAKGTYNKGKWTVVFVRDMKRAEGGDAEFVSGKKTYVNLAAWNGAGGDVNGMKSISIVWTPLVFDTER
ncbi:MAG: ethylbenzene dehydrogenase-related protein [Nitrospirae bacterium YQR-1]